MAKDDAFIGSLPVQGYGTIDDDEGFAGETTAANIKVCHEDLQDSDVFENKKESTTLPTSNLRKKSYNCSRCGKPLKGHTCTSNRAISPTVGLTEEVKRSRIAKRRFSIEEAAQNHLPSASATKANSVKKQNLGDFDESSWDVGKNLRDTRIRNWYDDDDDDVHIDTPKNPTRRMRKIQVESSSDNETVKLIPQTSSKRAYMCRMCGVPRKGHICQYVEGGLRSSGQQQPSQPLFPTPSKHNHKKQKQHNRNFVSVMERINYNGDSSDDDDNDDDEDKIPNSEILIPAHIFFDEVHTYISEQQQRQQECSTGQQQQQQQSRTNRQMMDDEKRNIQTWATKVYTKFARINERAYHEVQQSTKQKQMQESIMKERDAIMTLRNRVRCIQNDNRAIADHIVSLRQEHGRHLAASSFLSAIDALR